LEKKSSGNIFAWFFRYLFFYMITTIPTGASVANQTIRILSYMDDTIQYAQESTRPKDNAAENDVLAALYSMHKLSPTHAVITCPIRHKNFFYISENSQSIFGYDQQYMAAHFRELKDYISRVHEADTNDLNECIQFFSSFVQNEPPGDFQKLRAVFHYRFLHASGRSIYLQDEKAVLLTEKNKIIHYSLISKKPDEIAFAGVKLEVYKDENGLKKLFDYKPSASGNKLSNRERDLVQLIKQGLTTKEIASQLSISHNTVRNIKSKMFAKFNVTNTIELLNMTS
jgi:DNA-binding CsgD family transcriptional regulator